MTEEILKEITENCENCPRHENCPEEECILFRIEKIVLKEEDDKNGKENENINR